MDQALPPHVREKKVQTSEEILARECIHFLEGEQVFFLSLLSLSFLSLSFLSLFFFLHNVDNICIFLSLSLFFSLLQHQELERQKERKENGTN